MSLQRPIADEYNPYFQRYLDLVPEGNFENLFNDHTRELTEALKEIPADKEEFAYASGKWTVKQLVQHVSDTDRIFSYRALVAARGDTQTMLFSMDENQYAANADVKSRNLSVFV